MDYDYNRILFENRQITNKSALLWMELMAGMTGLIWLLGLLHVISTITWVFYILMPVSILLLLLPAVLNKVFKLSDSITMDAQKIKLLTISILGCSLSSVFLLSVALSPYVAIAWLFPMMIACQYYSRRITSATFLTGL